MSFNVTLMPAERSFEVQRDEPILSAAIRQGIGLPYGCRDGACGSCKSRLLEGRVIHGAHQSKALSLAEEAAPSGDSSQRHQHQQLHGARALEDAEACVMLMGKLPPGPEAGRVWMLLGSAARACGQLEKADTALGEAVKALMRERNGALAVCALHVRAAVAAALEDPEMGGWGVEGQKHLTFAALVANQSEILLKQDLNLKRLEQTGVSNSTALAAHASRQCETHRQVR